jgi:hypothetical protein
MIHVFMVSSWKINGPRKICIDAKFRMVVAEMGINLNNYTRIWLLTDMKINISLLTIYQSPSPGLISYHAPGLVLLRSDRRIKNLI